MQIEVELPTFHASQIEAWRLPGRFKVVRCGRRWGKSVFAETIAANEALRGHSVGIFTPIYKFQQELYVDLAHILGSAISTSSKVDGVIRTLTGGRIDFWTLDDPRAGRSRKYHLVVLDEASLGKPHVMDAWNKSIRYTLMDYSGSALVLGTPHGISDDNFFWQICNEPKHGFVEYWAPSLSNPLLSREELAETEQKSHPLVWQQEGLAQFVDFSGEAFFSGKWLLGEDGHGVPMPERCDYVFAVIDTAVKQGADHDATAVSYWSFQPWQAAPLTCLDWDLVSVDGALLERWVPNVFARVEQLGKECGSRRPSPGVFIEDAASGSILLQQCAARGWPATPLPSDLTAAGKDGRAINISGQVAQGRVKFSAPAHDKRALFNEHERNHMWTQVVGFRVGDKNAARRSDDLLDTFCYAVAVALGNSAGFA